MDQWICSRLYSTLVQCEQAFEAYELHTVTSALYSFWVHSLCDVYVVRSMTFTRHYGCSLMSPKKDRLEEKIKSLFLCMSSNLLTAQSKRKGDIFT